VSLLDSFQWAPGQGMLDTAKNTSFQAGATRDFAQTDLVNTENAAKQAELQDYISQSAKDMRETTRQAEIGKAKEQIANNEALSKVYAENPNLRSDNALLSVHADMMKKHQAMSEDEAKLSQQFASNMMDDKGNLNAENYFAQRDKMLQAFPDAGDNLPSREQVAANPGLLEGVKLRAAYSMYTPEQKAAQTAAKAKADVDMKLKQYEEGQQNARTSATIAGDAARTKATNEANAAIQAAHDRTRENVATIKATQDQKTKEVAMLNKQVPGLKEFGSIRDNIPLITTNVTQFALTHGIDASKEDIEGTAATVFPMAQSVYNEQAAQARQDLRDGKPYSIPKSVGEIATEMAQQVLTDPKQKANVKTWYQMNSKRISPDGDLIEKPSAQNAIQPSQSKKQVSTDIRDIALPENSQPKLGPETFGDDAVGKARYEKYRTASKDVQKATEDYFAQQHQDFIAQLKGQ
jgi:hypothetical protein